MKTFKIKDLVVSVGGQNVETLDAKFPCIGGTKIFTPTLCPAHTCGFFSPMPCPIHSITGCHGCTVIISICPGGSIQHCPGGSIQPPTDCGGTEIWKLGISPIIQTPEQIKVLREELKKLQVEMEAHMQPQTHADLDELEENLNIALKEVKAQRANMK